MGGDLDDLAEMQFGLAGVYISWSNYARSRELLAEAIGAFKLRRTRAWRWRTKPWRTSKSVPEDTWKRSRSWVGDKGMELCGAELQPQLIENLEHCAESLDLMRRKSESSWLRERIAQLKGEATQAHSA